MNTHRSFKLTRSDIKDGKESAGLGFPLVQQLVVLLFSSLILDGGVTFQILSYGALAYWVCVAIIFVRRRRCLTPMDKVVIRIGFLLASAISTILTGVIWHFRGV